MELRGKTAVVTGANTGIGRITAVELAKGGAEVVLACRSEEKAKPVVDEIRAAGGKADFVHLDLAKLASVRTAASLIVAEHPKIDLLINNAGLAGAHGKTEDGFEIAFGTNHVGPYLFTRMLLPALERADEARIVNVASAGHYRAPGIDFEAVRAPTVTSTAFAEYCVSKLANVLFTKELARRLPKSVRVYALHPGAVASDVWREVPWGLRHIVKLFMLSNEDGAKTTLYCATSDEVRNDTGLYYEHPCREKKASSLARDEALARTLWEKSAVWTSLPD